VRFPRVALFADCYHEVNGVANTMRHLTAFARERELPLLCVRAGADFRTFSEGSVRACEYRRSALRVPADQDLFFDPLFFRLLPALHRELTAFQPDLIHITGPGDCGILGTLLSRMLRVPLVASWHTNVHEFAARRLHQTFSFFPAGWSEAMSAWTERSILSLAALYYRVPRLILAPNPELARLLGERTGRPVHSMARGVDTAAFRPATPRSPAGRLRFGYVGRLTPEKNVQLLVEAERMLRELGAHHVDFVIVGDGGERAALSAAMPTATFTGVLKGEALAVAYSSMDAMLFPSHTDTYGNVVLEAQACGTPVLVTASGGPKYLVESGVSGWVARDDADFLRRVIGLAASPAALAAMRAGARRNAERHSWSQVFADLYASYDTALAPQSGRENNPLPAGAGACAVSPFPSIRPRRSWSACKRSTTMSASRQSPKFGSTLQSMTLAPSLRYWRSNTGIGRGASLAAAGVAVRAVVQGRRARTNCRNGSPRGRPRLIMSRIASSE